MKMIVDQRELAFLTYVGLEIYEPDFGTTARERFFQLWRSAALDNIRLVSWTKHAKIEGLFAAEEGVTLSVCYEELL